MADPTTPSPYDNWGDDNVLVIAGLSDGKPTTDSGKGSTDDGKGSTDDGKGSTDDGNTGGGGFNLGSFLDAAGQAYDVLTGQGNGGSSSSTSNTGAVPSSRPASGQGITEATVEGWLLKARNGLGGPAPSPQRYAAWLFLQHPTDPEAAFAAMASYDRPTPARVAVLACLWDIYSLAGLLGTARTGLRTPTALLPTTVRNDLNRAQDDGQNTASDDNQRSSAGFLLALALGFGGLIFLRTWL